jgi:hypothetical protein
MVSCTDPVWRANTASEWLAACKNRPDQPPFALSRMSVRAIIHATLQPPEHFVPLPLSALTLFIVIHALLMRLFRFCVESLQGMLDTAQTERELYTLQCGLHNWFCCWNQEEEFDKRSRPSNIKAPFFEDSTSAFTPSWF